jgi:two-component system, LytTR family, sensor kinase
MQADRPKYPRWVWVVLYVLVWTLFALLSAFLTYLSDLGIDHPFDRGSLLRQSFKNSYTCGVLVLGVFWFCNRNRLEPGRTARWVALHFAGALVFFAVYLTLTSWLIAGEPSVIHPGLILTFGYLVRKLAVEHLLVNLFEYWFVVFAHLGWHYYQRFRERELDSMQLQRELVQARLDALRMQLNPHFLFNTLHAVSALMHENPEAADRVIARLSELLRLSLDSSKPQVVPLADEMSFLERYLEIEQTRFGERLHIERHIEPETLRALVPYLILQPLVENAIRHGLEAREDQGRLVIEARRSNGRLELRVRDNGNGLEQPTSAAPGEGIGLSNTRSRLRHLYQEDFRFEMKGRPEGGSEARIEIPFQTEPAAL